MDILEKCDALDKITFLNKGVDLLLLNGKSGLDTLFGYTLVYNGTGKLKERTLTICGYKYSTADEFAVRLNTLQATEKAFGIKSVKFVAVDKKNRILDNIKVPKSITITKGKSKKLSIELLSTLKRVDKFTKKQGQVKISIAYSKERLNEWGCFFYDTKRVSKDTIKATKKGIGYAYTTVILPNGDKKVFATKVTIK